MPMQKFIATAAFVAAQWEQRTVTPRRRPNSELRPREHLTEREVEKLMAAVKGNRFGQRDSTMLLVCFRFQRAGVCAPIR